MLPQLIFVRERHQAARFNVKALIHVTVFSMLRGQVPSQMVFPFKSVGTFRTLIRTLVFVHRFDVRS